MGEPLRPGTEERTSAGERLFAFLNPVVFPVLAFLIVRFGVMIAARVSWVLGLIIAFVFAVLPVYLSRGLSRAFFEKFPTSVVITVFAVYVAVAIYSFAGVSYILMHQQIAIYEIQADYSIGTFADFYIWTFIDMLPSLDVWETLGVSSPATPKNVAAGLPVLAFRLFVMVFGILAAWKRWKKYREARNSVST